MLPGAIGALALLLRLYGLGDKPFWLDEVASAHRAAASVPHLVADSLHAGHFPTYFLILWLVARFGASQFLLRLPSAVFGAVAAALACAIGRRAAGARAGAIAGLLMALSPFEVQLGQEARSYTLVSCLILTALWGLVRLAQEPDAAAIPFRQKRALRGPWLAYGLATAAALDVLNAAVPWLIAANLGAMAIARAAGDTRRGFWRNWGGVQLAILAAWLPLLAVIAVADKGAVLDSVAWAPGMTVKALRSIVASIYFLRISKFITFGLAPIAVPGLCVAVVGLAGYGAWTLRRERVWLPLLGAAALALPVSLCLVSIFVPVMVPRYFAWSGAPFFIFAGIGFARFSATGFRVLAPVLAVLCLINLAPYYQYETKPRWDVVASELAAAAQPGDVVLVNSYYADFVLSAFAPQAGLDKDEVTLTWQLPDAMQRTPGHDLWVVYGRTGQAMRQSLADFRNSLAPLGQPESETTIGRYIVLWHYAEPEKAEGGAATGAGCGPGDKPPEAGNATAACGSN